MGCFWQVCHALGYLSSCYISSRWVPVYIHTYIHTYIYIYMHLHEYMYIYGVNICVCLCVCSYPIIHYRNETRIHTYIHTYSIIHYRNEIRIHTYVHTYIHTYIHIPSSNTAMRYVYIHTYVHTYINIYIHTYPIIHYRNGQVLLAGGLIHSLLEHECIQIHVYIYIQVFLAGAGIAGGVVTLTWSLAAGQHVTLVRLYVCMHKDCILYAHACVVMHMYMCVPIYQHVTSMNVSACVRVFCVGVGECVCVFVKRHVCLHVSVCVCALAYVYIHSSIHTYAYIYSHT